MIRRPNILRASPLRLLAERRARRNVIPYDMFDQERLGREARSAKILERVYHKGQDNVWDGKKLLAELIQKHGSIDLPDEQRLALQKIFSIILWGELAAWKVSAQLADAIEPLEAKMAATSQAHDEARHFYVMYDYLKLIGYEPGPLPPIAAQTIRTILNANSLAKKIVGMQLMVEPIALTLFQMTRQAQLEPVLCDLLSYYERDEARHIALGIHHLPDLLNEMDWREAIGYWTFQGRMYRLQLQGLRELEPEFHVLGFAPREAFRLGQGKQLQAAEMLADAMGQKQRMLSLFRFAFDFLVVYYFPEMEGNPGVVSRFQAGLRAARNGEAKPGALLDPSLNLV